MSFLTQIQALYPKTFSAKGLTHYEIKKKIKGLEGTSQAHYAYLMTGGGKVNILGKGTDDRVNQFTPFTTDIGGGGHMKAGVGALTSILFDDIEYIIVPAESDNQAKEIEAHLKQVYKFKDRPVKEVTKEVMEQRLEQLRKELPTNIYEDYYINNEGVQHIFSTMENISGSDFSTIKGYIYDYDKKYPGTIKAMNLFFRGHFKELTPTDRNPDQLALFERLVKHFFNVEV